MTCREKLMKEFPEFVNDSYTGGCADCPSSYGYLPDPNEYCDITESTCRDCWDREIPENKEETDMNPNEGAPNMIHAYVPRKMTTIEEAKQAIADMAKAFEKAEKVATKETNNDWQPRPAFPSPPQILDSGDRTEFATGAVRDMREGKGRCDLMPLEVVSHCLRNARANKDDQVLALIRIFQKTGDSEALYMAIAEFARVREWDLETMLLEVAKHFEEGAKKYGPDNWRKGIPTYCYIDSAVRHYLKWLRGDKDEPHDRAFVWNLMCCIWEVDYHKE